MARVKHLPPTSPMLDDDGLCSAGDNSILGDTELDDDDDDDAESDWREGMVIADGRAKLLKLIRENNTRAKGETDWHDEL